MVLIVMAAWWWWGSSGGVEIGGGNKVSEVKSTIRLVRVPVSASCLKSGAGVCVCVGRHYVCHYLYFTSTL